MAENGVREFIIYKPDFVYTGDSGHEVCGTSYFAISKPRAVNQALTAWGILDKKIQSQYRKVIRCEMVKKVRPKKIVLVSCEMCETSIARGDFVAHQSICEVQNVPNKT